MGLVFGTILAIGSKFSQNDGEMSAYETRLTELIDSLDGVSGARVYITYSESTSGNHANSQRIGNIYSAAVIADGGDIPKNEKKIIDIVSCMTGLPSDKIFVSGR